MLCFMTLTARQQSPVVHGKCSHYAEKGLQNAQIMLKIKDYAFPFGLCFLRQIMLKIMLA